jgi:septum site-determining protein MinD
MLAIAGGKGGVGKSTTALGLALELAARRGEAVVVDADRDMPDLHALAGLPNEPTVAALVGAGPGDDPATGERPLSAVTQRVPGSEAELLASAPGVGRRANRRALRRLSCVDRPVVVDCPAGAGTDVADPLGLAAGCVVVTRATPAGLRDGAKTAELARALGTPVRGAVLSFADRVPDGVDRLFEAPTVAVPSVDRPLGAPRARRARRRLLDRLRWPAADRPGLSAAATRARRRVADDDTDPGGGERGGRDRTAGDR